jgi:hypothetical protein
MNDNQSLLCECGNRKAKRAVACQRCLEIDRERIRGDTRRRVIQILKRFDWCPTAELWESIGAADTHDPDAGRAQQMLYRLIDEGVVERRPVGVRWEYRLKQGRRAA